MLPFQSRINYSISCPCFHSEFHICLRIKRLFKNLTAGPLSPKNENKYKITNFTILLVLFTKTGYPSKLAKRRIDIFIRWNCVTNHAAYDGLLNSPASRFCPVVSPSSRYDSQYNRMLVRQDEG